MLNKVPEITLYFWVIKILCTTVGETASDYLQGNLNLGLTKTTFITGGVLVGALVLQFRITRYVPWIYWLSVVLISVVGTQITDNLSDNYGVSLVTTTVGFSIALAAAFAVWYASERTLSIHTIVTTRRESFYWLAVLFTFALGTAAGDLTAERLNVGYWPSALMFGGLIAVVFAAHIRFGLNAVLAFWLAYVLTRPLGASIGDFLSQARAVGGLGLGTTVTSFIFLATILVVVIFLTVTKVDRIEKLELVDVGHPAEAPADAARVLLVVDKVAVSPALLDAVRGRAAKGPVEFVLLIPNPAHLAFDRTSHDTREGERLLAEALPQLEDAAGGPVEGAVATSPNAYDDIAQVLGARVYTEVILETAPSHLAHWLHVDLAERIHELGVPVQTVPAA